MHVDAVTEHGALEMHDLCSSIDIIPSRLDNLVRIPLQQRQNLQLPLDDPLKLLPINA